MKLEYQVVVAVAISNGLAFLGFLIDDSFWRVLEFSFPATASIIIFQWRDDYRITSALKN